MRPIILIIANIDVKGKIVLVWSGEPSRQKRKNLVSGTNKESEWATNWRKKVATAKEKGAELVFVVTEDQKAWKIPLTNTEDISCILP